MAKTAKPKEVKIRGEIQVGADLFTFATVGLLSLAAPPPSASGFNFQPLAVGAGGQLNGVDCAPDGTRLCWGDTFGCFLGSSGQTWQQLCTTSRLPSSAWSTPLSGAGTNWAGVCYGNSNVIYMATGQYGSNAIMFVSTNKGVSFAATPFQPAQQANNGRQRFMGPHGAIDPNNADVVYYSTYSNGVWKTANGTSGASSTWTQISTSTIPANAGTNNNGIVAIDGTSTLISGKSSKIYIFVDGSGLYASNDAGSTWVLVSGTSGWDAARIRIAADGTPYICLDASGSLYKLTWAGSVPSVTNVTPPSVAVSAFVCDPGNASHITAFPYNGGFQDSTNAGASWSTKNNTPYAYSSTTIPYNAQLQALLASFTGGVGLDTLDTVADPSTGPNYQIFSVGPQTVVQTQYPMKAAGTAQAWTNIGMGIEQLVGQGVCVPPGYAPICYSMDIAILQHPGDQNTYCPNFNWDTGNYLQVCHGLDYASSSPATCVAACGGFPDPAPNNPAVSSDGGLTWAPWPTIPASYANGSVAAASPTNWMYVSSGDAIYRTLNAGSTWTQVTSPAGKAPTGIGAWVFYWNTKICADRVNYNSGGAGIGTFYFQASGTNPGTYMSTDGGVTWTYNNNTIDNANIGSLQSVPNNAGHLWFSQWSGSGGSFAPNTNDKLYRSTNATSGASMTWTAVPGFNTVFGVGFGAPAPGKSYPSIYVYGYNGGVLGMWRSIDTTAAAIGTWQQLTTTNPDGGMYLQGWVDMVAGVAGDMNNYGYVYYARPASGFGVGYYP